MKSKDPLLVPGVLHLQGVVAELHVGVFDSVSPLQLDRIEARVRQLALGRCRRQRPGVEPGGRAVGARPDAVDRSNADGVSGVGA